MISGFTVISISGFFDFFPNLETPAFARDTDINLPDEILRNTSGLENVDLNQSANNELPPFQPLLTYKEMSASLPFFKVITNAS